MKKKTNTKLPWRWSYVRMGDIFIIERGGSPRPIEDFITTDADGVNWIKIGDTKGISKYIYSTKEKIRKEGMKKSRMVFEDDFILSNSMSFGRPYIMKTSGCIHDGWLVIRKSEKVNNDFLYYVLSSIEVYRQFSNLAKGSTVKNLNIEAVKLVEIPLPEIHYQAKIVSKIEELFSDIDNGIEELKKAQEQLKVYRQSVLAAGVCGSLTGDSKNYFNNITIGNPKDSYNGWKTVKLTEVARLESGHTPRKDRKEYWENGDILWLSLQDIRAFDGKIAMDTKFKTNALGIKNSSARILPKNTVCFCRDISVGYVTIMGKPMSTTQHFANWVCEEGLDSKFLMFSFMASRNTLITQGQGTTVKTIYMPDLKEMRIQLPSLSEQLKIVQEIESRLSVADKLQESIEEGLKKAEALKMSILRKAFRGELI
ncbi:MAG TPA: restriction endonuclease subunit S [Flavobacterium sp.]|nr:restriction endonuclease subunit S [Flavobacterium sp.]